MIVARFWAEHRLQHREGRKQITIRRWGWSDTGQGEADAMAKVRAEGAMAEALAGAKPARREPKVAYNGADGVPIREEILAEHPSCGVVVTRNRYGAHCLNVPDVLFADIDYGESHQPGFQSLLGCLSVVTFLVATVVADMSKNLWSLAAAGVVIAVLLIPILIDSLWRSRLLRDPGLITQKIRAWCEANPGWLIHLYQSPAGYRMLIGHALFDPASEPVKRLFDAFRVDGRFAQMCTVQRCFRARLTAKPWRIGVSGKMSYSAWPPQNEAAIQHRREWIATYEPVAQGHAACRFIATIGDGQEHPRAAAVRRLHDELSRAHSGLPLA